MSEESKPEEKKIIVDEDWKTQVEAEREATRKEPPSAEDSAAGPTDEGAVPLPPPTLTFLAGSLYLQGMMALGLLPSPGSDKPEVHLGAAKHTIDTLQMLEEKTEGNRTEEESGEFERILHEMRLAYVSVQQQAATPTDKEPPT
jgi:hypothetical protein